MTALEAFNTAAALTGYDGIIGENSGKDELLSKGLAAVDRIYSDLHYAVYGDEAERVKIKTMSDEIPLPPRVTDDILPYGVAMLLSLWEGDGENNQIWAQVYNEKRGTITKISKISDAQTKITG